MVIQKGERYRHYKGNEYLVLAIARHSETTEQMVIYEGQYTDPEFGHNPVWARPYDEFIEEVEVDGTMVSRFTHIT